MSNLHPVDSTTRTCCGGIGGHTPACDTNLTPASAALRDLLMAVHRTEDAHGYAKMAADELVDARASAAGSDVWMADARVTRCRELTEKLADALAFARRLAFVVEGDLRSEQQEATR